MAKSQQTNRCVLGMSLVAGREEATDKYINVYQRQENRWKNVRMRKGRLRVVVSMLCIFAKGGSTTLRRTTTFMARVMGCLLCKEGEPQTTGEQRFAQRWRAAWPVAGKPGRSLSLYLGLFLWGLSGGQHWLGRGKPLARRRTVRPSVGQKMGGATPSQGLSLAGLLASLLGPR